MSSIVVAPMPERALLQRYVQRADAYTDCFVTTIPGRVTLAEYVAAFYTTWVFKIERAILRIAVGRPSTDDDAARLGDGTKGEFAAWTVEARDKDQLLLCDMHERTRSWLMVESLTDGTRLYFGSAVVGQSEGAQRAFPWWFSPLLAFHKGYSRVLLGAARRRVQNP